MKLLMLQNICEINVKTRRMTDKGHTFLEMCTLCLLMHLTADLLFAAGRASAKRRAGLHHSSNILPQGEKESEKHKLKRLIFLRATMELARLSGPDRFLGAGEQ